MRKSIRRHLRSKACIQCSVLVSQLYNMRETTTALWGSGWSCLSKTAKLGNYCGLTPRQFSFGPQYWYYPKTGLLPCWSLHSTSRRPLSSLLSFVLFTIIRADLHPV
ncbi:hypothetical protein DPMN_114089 [Dreissena polymorpha]|uniref:Uncharacterized protein n=1 Tax=Dreissena polymorpha TaxID=45954 RepID=A0A9D4KJ88_DREPO|nr:hypothetical protein DPMN_114089 [Dreissena polymorpha]